MKVHLSLSNFNRMKKTLNDVGFEFRDTFTGELVKQSGQISKRAKEILSEKSQSRTSKRYWTGRLHDAIESRIVEREGSVVGTSVGVDLRKAPYAEWVEVGHSMGYDAGWWEGYHFLEGAFAELGPQIPNQISSTLKVTLKRFASSGGRFRNTNTGRFVRGSAGFTIQ